MCGSPASKRAGCFKHLLRKEVSVCVSTLVPPVSGQPNVFGFNPARSRKGEMCLLHPEHFIYTDPLLSFFTCLIFKMFKRKSLPYSASYEQHQGIPLPWPAPQGLLHCSVSPDIPALHCCCLLIREQDSSAVQYQRLCAQHSSCLGLPSGLQHFLGLLQSYGGQGHGSHLTSWPFFPSFL